MNVEVLHMKSLEEILQELNAAEKEYAQKCKEYGIEEKGKRKKEEVIDEITNEGETKQEA